MFYLVVSLVVHTLSKKIRELINSAFVRHVVADREARRRFEDGGSRLDALRDTHSNRQLETEALVENNVCSPSPKKLREFEKFEFSGLKTRFFAKKLCKSRDVFVIVYKLFENLLSFVNNQRFLLRKRVLLRTLSDSVLFLCCCCETQLRDQQNCWEEN